MFSESVQEILHCRIKINKGKIRVRSGLVRKEKRELNRSTRTNTDSHVMHHTPRADVLNSTNKSDQVFTQKFCCAAQLSELFFDFIYVPMHYPVSLAELKSAVISIC